MIEDIFAPYPNKMKEASRKKLKNTTAFVAGAGARGSIPISQLALFGFENIKICDCGEIDLTDLHGQFFPDHEHLGMNKALSAEIIVNKIHPGVKVSSCTQKLDRNNVFDLVGDAGIIFDTLVNPADRFILSECAVAKGIPHVIISTSGMAAYAAVFHTPKTACYHCIFDKKKLEIIISGMKENVTNYRKQKSPALSASLSIGSVIAVNAAMKILLDFNNPGYNKFFYYNQEGKPGNFVHGTGYKAMTHLFTGHFRQLCREQGFDWDVGWRGKYLEELTITADPACLLCGKRAVSKGDKQ
jgi:molybdopterin/thiamine biosynthesis adenylyltransferase